MCDHIQPTFASFIQEVCKPRLCATYLGNFVQHTVNQASRSAGEGGGGVAGPSGARLGMRCYPGRGPYQALHTRINQQMIKN